MNGSTLPAASVARPAAGAGALLTDAWVITQRDLRHWLRQPWTVIIGWLFPVMTVLLFAGLFGGAIMTPGGEYVAYLMPGMFALTMLFGLEATMMAVTTDADKGVTDRFRSLPMHTTAVLLGRCVADMLNSVVGLVVMVATGLALGWRWEHGAVSALAAFGLLLWLRFALLWVGICIGLRARGPQAVTAAQILVWPIGFLSGVFVDPATMPRVLNVIATWNPLTITAAAARHLFGSPGAGGATWAAQYAMPLAVIIPLAITAIFLPLSAVAYRNLNR